MNTPLRFVAAFLLARALLNCGGHASAQSASKPIHRMVVATATEAQVGQDKSSQVRGIPILYRDKKNAYFMFAAPEGWTSKEIEDARTKVQFVHPQNSNVLLRFIVREAPGETFADMRAGDESTAHAMRSRGFECRIDTQEFMGVGSTEVSAVFPGNGGYTVLRKFLVGGLHFNIQFTAPTKALFDRHRQEAMESLDTIVVRKQKRDDPQLAQEQGVSHYLRFADLTKKLEGTAAASQVLNEAQAQYPKDKRIKAALADLRR